MKLFIFTSGRWTTQGTLDNMPKGWRDRVTLVVQEMQLSEYSSRFPNECLAIPREITTLPPSRQWVLENYIHDDYVCMMDDDLRFFARREDELSRFRAMEPADWDNMFAAIRSQLADHAHVGVLSREGGNRIMEEVVYNTRMSRILCYHRPTLIEQGIRFDRLIAMEDFDVTLQLLIKGYPNAVLCNWVHNQTGGSNSPGGCSVYRTLEVQAECARKFHDLFPKYVTVVQKDTKGAWGGGTRTDVRMQWKRAFNDHTNK